MAINECVFGNQVKWMDITSPAREELESIFRSYGFNSFLLFDTLDPDHLPKFDVIRDLHFLIVRYYIHSIENKLPSIQDLTSRMAIFYTDSLLITVHDTELHFLAEIRRRYLDTRLITTAAETVAKVLWYVLDTFEAPVQRLSEQVDFFEKQIFLKTIEPQQLEALYYIKQRAAMCQRLLTLTLEPISRIRTEPEDDAAWDDVKDHHLKVMTLHNLVLDDVSNLMNLYMSFSAQKTNDVMKILTIFSVFFMPLTFLVGIYGMNFQYMPELGQKWGYPLVLLLMAVIVAIIYFWFKRKKWL